MKKILTLLFALAGLMYATAHAQATVEAVAPEALADLIKTYKGQLVINVSSLDTRCLYCVRANAKFKTLAATMGNKARFIQVTWQPWSPFPPAIEHYMASVGATLAVPLRLVYNNGELVNKLEGDPPADKLTLPTMTFSGKIKVIESQVAPRFIRQSKGVLVVMLSSFESDCAFCMRGNPQFESLAQASESSPSKPSFVRVMYSPWTSMSQDPFAQEYQVRGLPVFLTFKDGTAVRGLNGAWEVEKLREKLLDGIDEPAPVSSDSNGSQKSAAP